MKTFFVYIITNKYNRVLYIGMTNNIFRRLSEHKNRLNKCFSSKYNLTKLVYVEKFNGPLQAIKREKQVKGWLRKKKITLIEKDNPNWHDLHKEKS